MKSYSIDIRESVVWEEGSVSDPSETVDPHVENNLFEKQRIQP